MQYWYGGSGRTRAELLSGVRNRRIAGRRRTEGNKKKSRTWPRLRRAPLLLYSLTGSQPPASGPALEASRAVPPPATMLAAARPVSAHLLLLVPLPSPARLSHPAPTRRLYALAPARRPAAAAVRARRESSPPSAPSPPAPAPADSLDCVGAGSDVECFVDAGAEDAASPLLPTRSPAPGASKDDGKNEGDAAVSASSPAGRELWEWASLVSPFFFWGTAMVAMKGVIPRTGPFFVAALRLLPAGALLVAFAAARGRKQPSGWEAWLAIAAFGLIDAACFQVHTRRHVDSSRRELLAPVPPRVCLWFLESKARCLFLVAFTGLPRGGIAEDVGWARERKAKSKLPRCSLAHQARQAIALSSWPGELVALTQFNSPFQVIIDSQPLTVAILASLLFGESIGAIGVGGLVLGVVGLLLLEVCLLLMRVQT